MSVSVQPKGAAGQTGPRKEVTMAKNRRGNSRKAPKKYKYRSSVTGHYVSEHYAKTHPRTTQRTSK